MVARFSGSFAGREGGTLGVTTDPLGLVLLLDDRARELRAAGGGSD
jgi:hypothetical protein